MCFFAAPVSEKTKCGVNAAKKSQYQFIDRLGISKSSKSYRKLHFKPFYAEHGVRYAFRHYECFALGQDIFFSADGEPALAVKHGYLCKR